MNNHSSSESEDSTSSKSSSSLVSRRAYDPIWKYPFSKPSGILYAQISSEECGDVPSSFYIFSCLS